MVTVTLCAPARPPSHALMLKMTDTNTPPPPLSVTSHSVRSVAAPFEPGGAGPLSTVVTSSTSSARSSSRSCRPRRSRSSGSTSGSGSRTTVSSTEPDGPPDGDARPGSSGPSPAVPDRIVGGHCNGSRMTTPAAQAFDFIHGTWTVHNRKLRDVADPACDEWVEFSASSEAFPVLQGVGHLDRMTVPEAPDGPAFEGLTLRLFDP